MVKPPYPIDVAVGGIERLPDTIARVAADHRVAVITDTNVDDLYGARVRALLGAAPVLAIPPGEEQKTRATWARLTDELIGAGFGRDTVVVALGGGVVGDLAGFVAATYMRGVPVIQVPTTLLAMVDASVGGKTGVDTAEGKNLVGAFHQPAAVLVDPWVLQTLPAAHLAAGFAEVLKHGVVADAHYFEQTRLFLERGMAPGHALGELEALVRKSIEIKSGIVARDERESGLRKVLNFGHTIGHAVEAASGYRMLHGNAVATGMVAEASLAERIGIADSGTASAIETACRSANLPSGLPDIPVEALLRYMQSDKKRRAGRLELALPQRIGQMAAGDQGWTVAVDDATMRKALAR